MMGSQEKVVYWHLRKKDVLEKFVRIVMEMYVGANAMVRTMNRDTILWRPWCHGGTTREGLSRVPLWTHQESQAIAHE